MTTPFLKWAGGKYALLPQLRRYFPTEARRHIEPFVGGGGVFFGLEPSTAILGDMNAWLMDTYAVVREHPEALMDTLDGMVNTRETYLHLRAQDPATVPRILRAALFVYLNKTGFRGLFRVNRKGRFNVSYGAYQRPYYDRTELLAASRALQNAELFTGDYRGVLDRARPGDFVYLDPPYPARSETADFDRYTPTPFRDADHVVLAENLRALHRRRIRWALSCRDTPTIRALYAGFTIHTVHARREINLDAARRQESEILLTNDP